MRPSYEPYSKTKQLRKI